MANGVTYGINFPFRDSFDGRFLDLSSTIEEEIRTDLIHLLLTRKGTRYFLPDFGTRLLEYIFEPLDGPTFSEIESEIRDSVSKYVPNLVITKIAVYDASTEEDDPNVTVISGDERVFRVPGIGTKEHTAKVRIDYKITSNVFESSDFIIINI
jgi:phage baseplate assembly protein W